MYGATPRRSLRHATASLAALTGRILTILRAGLALKTVGSFVNGLMPWRALVGDPAIGAEVLHQADFEQERGRCKGLAAEVLKTTADLMAAREAAARLAGELETFQARPWWRRLAG